jgi:preprotein translocase subunit SecD
VDFDAPTVQSVSATLGKDSLDAAILAGLFGVALVLFFLFAYYRLLAVVAIGGLVVSGMLLWSVIAWLSRTNGLAFTLSGAAGVIVSIGTGADSYIMLFERLKEDIRAGRTLRNSAVRSFENSWRTIIVANTSTLIGAVILWWLSIGSVRGFAFFLGLSSLTSMIAVYFFTRPAVLLIANWHRLNTRGVLGVKSSQVLGGEKS